jgi:hypothetical protein
MAHEKNGMWWGLHPENGLKQFSSEKEAVAWEGNADRSNWYGEADIEECEDCWCDPCECEDE